MVRVIIEKVPLFIRYVITMEIMALWLLVVFDDEQTFWEEGLSGNRMSVAETMLMEEMKPEEWIGAISVAAYCECEKCIKKGSFASGIENKLKPGRSVAADLSIFHIGDLLRIGSEIYRVEEGIQPGGSEKVKIYFDNHERVVKFGRKTFQVFKVRPKKRQEEFLGVFQITGYCGCEKCCGKWSDGFLTKSGTRPQAKHTIATDPKILPLGSEVKIDGIVYTAEDTGKKVKDNTIDIYFETHEQALNFGRQEKEVYLIK